MSISKLESSKQKRVKIKTAFDIYKVFKAILEGESKLEQNREHFWIMVLTHDKWLLSVNTVVLGDFHRLIVNPLDTFQYAIDQDHACYSIIAHNHPNGDVEPSQEDIIISNEFYQFSRKINIVLIDSLVISLEKYYSFEENRIIKKFKDIYENSDPEILKDKGLLYGENRKNIEVARKMFANGVEINFISKYTKLTPKDIKKIGSGKKIGIEGNKWNQKIDCKKLIEASFIDDILK